MPRIHPYNPSFNTGELSPRLAARTDFSKYPSGCETVQNMIPLSEGGLMRRSGTRFAWEVKDSMTRGRLKRFQFSTTQAYVLEFGDRYMRFGRHQGQIVTATTDAQINNGTFENGTIDWLSRSTGNGAISYDFDNKALKLDPGGSGATDIGWAEQSVLTTYTGTEHVLKFRVIGTAGDKVEFQVGTGSGNADTLSAVEKEVGTHCVAFTPTSSPFFIQFRNLGSNANKAVSIDDVALICGTPVEIDTPYAAGDLYQVEGPQSADVLYLFHGEYPTYKLQRYDHQSWSLVEVPWQDGPWLDQNLTDTALTPAATSGTAVNITASSTFGINNGEGFKISDIGRLVRIDNDGGSNWGWGVITDIPALTQATVFVKRNFSGVGADTRWRLGAWSGTTGYPSVGTFFEQRLYAAGSATQPQTFWASQTSDFENHAPDSPNDSDGKWSGTVHDDDALDYTISADDVSAIRWLSAGEDTLAIGTVGGEWVPSSQGTVLTPSDIAVRQQTTHGSARVQPLRVDNVVLFLQRARRKIREFGFAFESDGYQAFDMTRLAQHITRGGIVEMAFAEEPDSQVWAVRSDGVLLSMTFRREEDVVGWARHTIGGAFEAGDAVVESVTVVPGDDGVGQVQSSTDRDEVWFIVKRTINGTTRRYVEFLERDFECNHSQPHAYYLDSLVTYEGSPGSVIGNLQHLEGETVGIWADGAIQPDQQVSGGQVTLASVASIVQIGLRYAHRYKSLKIEGGNPAGTATGKPKRIYGVTFVLLNSHTLNFGPEVSHLREKDFRLVADPLDEAAPLFTGEQFIEFDGDWGADARIVIESDDPAPFTLLAMAPEVGQNPFR